jgi:hypothetical protein
MTGYQISKAKMYKQVRLFFQKFYQILKVIVPLKEEIDLFYLENEKIEPLLELQLQNTSVVTQNKEELKNNAIDDVLTLVKKARPWAKKTGNKELIDIWNIAETDLRGDEMIAAALMDNAVKALGDHEAELVIYNINNSEIKAATNSVSKFDEAIGTPKQQIEVAKINTEKIPETIKTIDKILEQTDDLIEGNFAKTEAEAFKEYLAARIIGHYAGKHTAVIVYIYADAEHKNPLAGATISIEALNRQDVSDAIGLAEIIKFKAGTYQLKISAPGYKDQTLAFTVKNGKHVELMVVMG